MQLSTRLLKICLALYFFAQAFFLINIQFPRGQNFDEFHYVPAAKQFLAFKEPRNLEHPPLGKIIMAASIGVFGDRPIGWRFTSTVFGALTLVGMFLWGWFLFKDEKTALWVALLSLFNQFLYVQARIGMLDTFMFAFLVWGLAAFCAAWDKTRAPGEVQRLLRLAAILLGLGTACKWFGLMPFLGCLGLAVMIRILQYWKVSFGRPAVPAESDWYEPTLWAELKISDWVRFFVLPYLGAYLITFVPYVFMSESHFGLLDFITVQKRMWEDQLRVVNSHPYMSQWSQWPLISRPIWYAFDKEPGADSFVRGVLLIGNPLVMWGGLVALGVCAWSWIRDRNRQAFLIVAFYFFFFASWVLIPRKVAFYYYYYPAAMTLSLALAYVFALLERKTTPAQHYRNSRPVSSPYAWARWAFLACSAALFVYFFPILSALKISGNSYQRWMWFTSWI